MQPPISGLGVPGELLSEWFRPYPNRIRPNKGAHFYKYLVSVSENMVAGADPTPLTTTVSLIYDAKKPESPPEIGLGFNIEL